MLSIRPAVTRDAAAAASGFTARSVKSEAALARAAGVMVSPEEVAAEGVLRKRSHLRSKLTRWQDLLDLRSL